MTTRAIAATFLGMLLWASQAAAEPLRGVELKRDITRELQRQGVSAARPNAVIWAEADALTPEQLDDFADLVDAGVVATRLYLGETLDLPGDDRAAVHFFISRRVGIATVTVDPLPHVFMRPELVLSGRASYLHELVHAMAQWSWRRSEWMAEGFANHAAAEIARRYGGFHATGPEPRGLAALSQHAASTEGDEVMPLIGLWGRRGSYTQGSRALFGKVLTQRRRYAAPYYTLSWSYVDFLMAELGLTGLHRVATADDPDAVARQLTGRRLDQLKAEWQAGLRKQ